MWVSFATCHGRKNAPEKKEILTTKTMTSSTYILELVSGIINYFIVLTIIETTGYKNDPLPVILM